MTKKNELTEGKSSKCLEIIKPVLRGKDIQRFRAKGDKLWIIVTHNGYDGLPAIDLADYPSIKEHLDTYYARLDNRDDKGVTPYNLRSCEYYTEFAKEKLFWMDLTERGRFAYDNGTMYCINTVFMMTGNSLKYLCALLNSSLMTWFMQKIAPSSGMGVTRWIVHYVRTIPIAKISVEEQYAFIEDVDRILAAKEADSLADISDLEAEIDQKVYALYGLGDKEIKLVESSGKN